MSDFHFIKCTIERGGFASERTFTFKDAKGQEVNGISNVDHLCDENMTTLDDEELPHGTKITGFVKCRAIRENGSGEILVDLPNSEVVYVRSGELMNSCD